MSLPRFEIAQGAIDGVNTTFTVSVPYVPNTTAIFLNGKMYRRDWDDGWVETSPTTGVITLKEAPLLGDVVQVFFTDLSAVQLGEEITPLFGRIQTVDGIRGLLCEVEIRGAILRT